jgi:hypothetical protein
MFQLGIIKRATGRMVIIVTLLAAACAFARGAEKHSQKDYTLALEISETKSAEKAHDVSLAKL